MTIGIEQYKRLSPDSIRDSIRTEISDSLVPTMMFVRQVAAHFCILPCPTAYSSSMKSHAQKYATNLKKKQL